MVVDARALRALLVAAAAAVATHFIVPVPPAGPSEAQRASVRAAHARGALFASRWQGVVRCAPAAEGGPPGGAQCVAALAECGTPGCGCDRLLYPHVRPAFEAFVRRRCASAALECPGSDLAAAARGERGLVYASFGSGALAQDWALLECLAGGGLAPPQRLCLIDAEYVAGAPGIGRLGEGYAAALSQLAAWHAPAEVCAFASAEAYAAACAADAGRYAADVLIACDAADLRREGNGDTASHGGAAERAQGAARFSRREVDAAVAVLCGALPSVAAVLDVEAVLRPGGVVCSLINAGGWAHRGDTNRASHARATARMDCYLRSASTGQLEAFGEAGVNEEHPAARARRRFTHARRAREVGANLWRVVFSPRVVVRSAPSESADILGVKKEGEFLAARGPSVRHGFVELHGGAEALAEQQRAFCMVSHPAHGVLLEPVSGDASGTLARN